MGALAAPLFRGWARGALLLAVVLLSFKNLLGLELGTSATLTVMGLELTWLRVDRLSMLFGQLPGAVRIPRPRCRAGK